MDIDIMRQHFADQKIKDAKTRVVNLSPNTPVRPNHVIKGNIFKTPNTELDYGTKPRTEMDKKLDALDKIAEILDAKETE